jgi:cell division protein FtsB
LQTLITKSREATALEEQQKVNDTLANENAALKAQIEGLKNKAAAFANSLHEEQQHAAQ